MGSCTSQGVGCSVPPSPAPPAVPSGMQHGQGTAHGQCLPSGWAWAALLLNGQKLQGSVNLAKIILNFPSGCQGNSPNQLQLSHTPGEELSSSAWGTGTCRPCWGMYRNRGGCAGTWAVPPVFKSAICCAPVLEASQRIRCRSVLLLREKMPRAEPTVGLGTEATVGRGKD